MELQAAGDNAKEKLRIEEAYLEAQKALRKKYRIDEMDENKIFLETWTEDMQEWLQSDLGQAVTGSLSVISSGMSSIFQQLSSLIQAETDIQVAAIEKRYKTEISNAEGNNYQVKKLEKQKEKEIAKVKNDANKGGTTILRSVSGSVSGRVPDVHDASHAGYRADGNSGHQYV